MPNRRVEWEIIDYKPLQGIRLFKESGKRYVEHSPDNLIKLLEALTTPLVDIVEFAIYTGFRRDNILSSRIENFRVDSSQQTGEVHLVVKGGRKEVFPLSLQTIALLQRVIADHSSGYGFINPVTSNRYVDIHRSFDKTVRTLNFKVGNTKLRFHNLCHVFATWLHQSGVSLDALRPLLGHRDRDTTDRYAYLDRKDTGKVLNIMPRIRRKKDLDELTPRSKSKGFLARIGKVRELTTGQPCQENV
jgi:integrase